MANKFDSIVERAVDEATIESIRRREREAIENIKYILSHYAADEDEDDDEGYGEDEFDDDDDDDDWLKETGEWDDEESNKYQDDDGE
jgi:hypothetical protein